MFKNLFICGGTIWNGQRHRLRSTIVREKFPQKILLEVEINNINK